MTNFEFTLQVKVFEITDPLLKADVVRRILEALPDWFGQKEAREAYIASAGERIILAAESHREICGFLALKETGRETAEIEVMGVLPSYHRQGMGTALVQKAMQAARQKGYRFMQVKTVQEGRYPEYDQTNRFYQKNGFSEFEVFPDLWDAWNPCQVYVKYLF